MGGDFNCPSSHWDATVLRERPMATRLMECATSLNMERVAPPSGRVTHLPYNAVLRGSILNLVFLPIYWGYTADLTIGDKGKPDHFLLLLDIPLKVFWQEGKMSIKADSEEEADFLGEVIISLGQILIPDIMSVDHTQAVAQTISKVFDLAWMSLSICKVLVPWLRHHPNNCVHFHHITPGVELEDHQLVHILATSTRVEAGGALVISADFARCRAVTQMLEGWNSLFQSKKYIRSNFLTLYQRKDTPFVPTHIKSGPWMCKAGHSHLLTARLVCCTTGHAPIGAYHS
jgi:hypothetical protein